MRTYQWLTLGAAILIAVLEIWFFADASAVASQPEAAPAAAVSLGSRADGPPPLGWSTAPPPAEDTGAGPDSYFVYCTGGARVSGADCAAALAGLAARKP